MLTCLLHRPRHVRRAVTIANLLGIPAHCIGTPCPAILDMLAVAAVLVDASAITSERCNHDLRLAITEAAAAGEVRVPKTGLSVVLKGTDDRDLAAWVLPLGSGLQLSLGAPYAAQAAVFVRELGSTSPFPAELLCSPLRRNTRRVPPTDGARPRHDVERRWRYARDRACDGQITSGASFPEDRLRTSGRFGAIGDDRLGAGYSVNGPSADCSQLQPCDRLPSLRQDKRIAVLGFRCVPKRAQGRIWGSCAAQRRRLTPNRRRKRSGSLVLADGLR